MIFSINHLLAVRNCLRIYYCSERKPSSKFIWLICFCNREWYADVLNYCSLKQSYSLNILPGYAGAWIRRRISYVLAAFYVRPGRRTRNRGDSVPVFLDRLGDGSIQLSPILHHSVRTGPRWRSFGQIPEAQPQVFLTWCWPSTMTVILDSCHQRQEMSTLRENQKRIKGPFLKLICLGSRWRMMGISTEGLPSK